MAPIDEHIRTYLVAVAVEVRTAALGRWLHHYNHHRRHTALGGLPPVSRVTNVPVQYS